MRNDHEAQSIRSCVGFTVGMVFIIAVLVLGLMCSCTLSMQNISTHGTATDLVDDALQTSPTVSPDITIPVSLVPK